MAGKQIGTIKTPYGPGAIVTATYPSSGALAVIVDEADGFDRIATVSVNLDHGQPCVQSGALPRDHFYVDANNLGADLMKALLESGYFETTALPDGVSGYCTYPVWKLVARESATAGA